VSDEELTGEVGLDEEEGPDEDPLEGAGAFDVGDDADEFAEVTDEDDDAGADVPDPFDDGDATSTDSDDAAVADVGAVDAAEDDDDEVSAEPAVDIGAIDGLDELLADDDDDGDDEGLRPDEFVCRSCHMARRGSALADPDALLCRDCV
jgi:hypothetical protein